MSIHSAAAASALPRLPVSWKEFGELLRASQTAPKSAPKQEPVAKIGGYDKARISYGTRDPSRSSDAKDLPDTNDVSDSENHRGSTDVLDLNEEAESMPSQTRAEHSFPLPINSIDIFA